MILGLCGSLLQDNCRFVSNANQNDVDRDNVGDVCDTCIYYANPKQVSLMYLPIITALYIYTLLMHVIPQESLPHFK